MTQSAHAGLKLDFGESLGEISIYDITNYVIALLEDVAMIRRLKQSTPPASQWFSKEDASPLAADTLSITSDHQCFSKGNASPLAKLHVAAFNLDF